MILYSSECFLLPELGLKILMRPSLVPTTSWTDGIVGVDDDDTAVDEVMDSVEGQRKATEVMFAL